MYLSATQHVYLSATQNVYSGAAIYYRGGGGLFPHAFRGAETFSSSHIPKSPTPSDNK